MLAKFERPVSTHLLLNVAGIIRADGVATEQGYQLGGVTLVMSYDGYTFVLKNNRVSLTLHFHNTYDIDAPDNDSLDQFYAQLKAIDAKAQ